MAKTRTACRYLAFALLGSLPWFGWTVAARAQGASEPALAASQGERGTYQVQVPRVIGRLTAHDIGLVINTADPYSEAVGQHYIDRRKLAPEQVLRVQLPLRAALTPEEFERLRRQIDEHFGARTQALALAWRLPYAVNCNGLTGALALGYDAELCQQSCARSRSSGFFNSRSSRPFEDHGFRLSMQLAARDVAEAKALIDRGVTADRSLGRRGAPPVQAWFLATSDASRSVRARLFPPSGHVRGLNVDIKVERAEAPQQTHRVMLYLTGLRNVAGIDGVDWVPGALADHLTSFGGQLDREEGQMTALAWIGAGATASYGTASEPCNHLQKFPHPQLLLLHYLQGSTAIEAYWKSVAWPQQGVFVGEPLAAPFAK
jgi:uncharacterized protein (TIGR03790 family)